MTRERALLGVTRPYGSEYDTWMSRELIDLDRAIESLRALSIRP
jgi:hypothetical protein